MTPADFWFEMPGDDLGDDSSELDDFASVFDVDPVTTLDLDFHTVEFDTVDIFADPDVPDYLDIQHFDPSAPMQDVTGDPASHMEHWHAQENPESCAVVSQMFILRDVIGEVPSEDVMRDMAIANGSLIPTTAEHTGGTAMMDIGNVLEGYGFDVDRGWDVSLDDLEEALGEGEYVIVGVHGMDMLHPPGDSWLDRMISNIPGIPDTQANHAVQVTGIVTDENGERFVVLNDPGHEWGRGLMLPEQQFVDSWNTSSNFMMTASAPEFGYETTSWTSWPSDGGYYNLDGTFHWAADGTDRDPATGAVVRR